MKKSITFRVGLGGGTMWKIIPHQWDRSLYNEEELRREWSQEGRIHIHRLGHRNAFHSPWNQEEKRKEGVGGVNEMEHRLRDGLVRRKTNS